MEVAAAPFPGAGPALEGIPPSPASFGWHTAAILRAHDINAGASPSGGPADE